MGMYKIKEEKAKSYSKVGSESSLFEIGLVTVLVTAVSYMHKTPLLGSARDLNVKDMQIIAKRLFGAKLYR